MRSKVLIGIGCAVAAVFVAACFLLFTGTGAGEYYTQIDNQRIEEAPESGVVNLSGSGGLKYQYNLTAYDGNGHAKDLTFGSDRELREGAFLELEVMPFRGVMKWEEVAYEDLPEAVKAVYGAS